MKKLTAPQIVVLRAAARGEGLPPPGVRRDVGFRSTMAALLRRGLLIYGEIGGGRWRHLPTPAGLQALHEQTGEHPAP